MEDYKSGHIYFASESVGEGHPDKLCDQVSDGILDACLKVDPNAKVAMETATKTRVVFLLGETNVTKDQVNFEQVARQVCKDVGYDAEEKGLDCNKCDVIQVIHAQDANIAASVHGTKSDEDLGAGDQGLMFGYATDEWDTERLHPYSHHLSNAICEELAAQRHSGEISWLRPDCKS